MLTIIPETKTTINRTAFPKIPPPNNCTNTKNNLLLFPIKEKYKFKPQKI